MVHTLVRMSRILPGPQDFLRTIFQPVTCAGEMFRPNRAILLRQQRLTLRQVDKVATYDNLVETTRKFQQGEFCPVQRRFGQVCPANLAQEPGNPTRSATDPWSISFDALPPAVWPMQRHKWLPMAAVLLLPCLAQVSPHQAARSPPRGWLWRRGDRCHWEFSVCLPLSGIHLSLALQPVGWWSPKTANCRESKSR